VQTTRHSFAAVLHQELRYKRSERRNFFSRFSYAVAETFVYRIDSGIVLPNLANLAGAAAGGYVTRLYLPPGFDGVSHANTRMEYQFGTIMATNVLTEFGRSLYKFSHRTHIPFIQSVPEWWTGGTHNSAVQIDQEK